jgi:crotonobetainyl-CoA:carnitine CoA-transferase CaiB-like acyl-CoA transferase
MDNGTPKYGKKYLSENEAKPVDIGTQFIFMVNGNITYAQDLLDALYQHRKRGLETSIPYEEIDRARRIANYLTMALEEFRNKR